MEAKNQWTLTNLKSQLSLGERQYDWFVLFCKQED